MKKKSLDPARIVIKKLIVSYLVKLGLAASGPLNWVTAFIVNNILKKLQAAFIKLLNYMEKYLEVKKENQESLKEYKQTLENPQATKEEVKDAGKKFLED